VRMIRPARDRREGNIITTHDGLKRVKCDATHKLYPPTVEEVCWVPCRELGRSS
jgi:hypothetical protein